MMTAHVGGVPIEELVVLLAPSGGAAIVVARIKWQRFRRAHRVSDVLTGGPSGER